MRKEVFGILTVMFFILRLTCSAFGTAAPDLAVTSISGTLRWDSSLEHYNLDYAWTVTNVGSVKAFYTYEVCLYPWDGGPFAVELQLPTGEWVWVSELEYTTTQESLDIGQSRNRFVTNLDLGPFDSAFIGSKSGVYILAFVHGVMAEDGSPERNVNNNIGKSWMSSGTSVGGIVVSVDKLGLLAPYIGLASTIPVATCAIGIYIKRVKRKKEKQ